MSWKENKINVAIQVLPEADGKLKYALVDEAIKAIAESGFRYRVCPFETVVECNFSDFGDLFEKIHDAFAAAGTEQILTNLKVQINFAGDVSIDDKMEKYT